MLSNTERYRLAQAPKHFRTRIAGLLGASRKAIALGNIHWAKVFLGRAKALMQDALCNRIPVRLKFNSRVLRCLVLPSGGYLCKLKGGGTVRGTSVRAVEAVMRAVYS